jgi:hypothetical protein
MSKAVPVEGFGRIHPGPTGARILDASVPRTDAHRAWCRAAPKSRIRMPLFSNGFLDLATTQLYSNPGLVY